MAKQLILSIGRELGSGGSEVGQLVAEKLGIKLYDKNILDGIAEEKHTDTKYLEEFDEKPTNFIRARKLGEHASPEDVFADMQFSYMQKLADSGESFVIVGRCADSVFRGNDGLTAVFVYADMPFRISRVQEMFGIDKSKAEAKILHTDKQRKAYHNRYSDSKWGEKSSYDLCVSSSSLGIEKAAELIIEFIKLKQSE